MPPCGTACPFCRNEHLDFTGEIVTPFLLKFFNNKCDVEPKDLNTDLYENANRQEIWKCAKSNVKPGMVNSLVLQLFACSIVRVDMGCKISLAVHADTTFVFALEDSSYWKLLNTV
jgi:hypothetical protein